jgi:hypothetical protein
MLGRVSAIVLLATIVSSTTVQALPNLPKEAVPILKCAYRRLASHDAVLSIDVYAADNMQFRSAIEYRVRNKAGRILVSDIGFMTVDGDTTYDGVGFRDEASGVEVDEWQFFWVATKDVEKCHVKAAGDLMLPLQKPRSQWHVVDLSKET